MRDDLARFRSLTGLERGFLIRALLLLPVVGWGLRLIGFGRVQATLQRFMAAPRDKSTGDDVTKKVLSASRMVSIVSRRGIYRANCLPTSLTLEHLLGQQGIDTDLRVGVRKVAGVFEAHAWVEFLGQPLNEDDDVHERFAAFDVPIDSLKKASG